MKGGYSHLEQSKDNIDVAAQVGKVVQNLGAESVKIQMSGKTCLYKYIYIYGVVALGS